MTTTNLNARPFPFKRNGNGHARAKSAIACAVADLVDAVSAHNPDADVSVLIRALAEILDVCPGYVGLARRLSPEQRKDVRLGLRPVIVPRLDAKQIAALLANGHKEAHA